MKRTFNYTGRRRIDRQRVAIAVQPGAPAKFQAEIDLADLGLPDGAQVYVEAYRSQTAFLRYDFGTLDQLSPPSDLRLVGIEDPRHLRFRVKVVDLVKSQPRLLAVADKVPPAFPSREEGAAERTILDPVFVEYLGEEIWRVDFEEYADEPVLLVNKHIFGIREAVASDPTFAGLVYPDAFRTILTRAIESREDTDEDDDESGGWARDWIAFAVHLGASPVPHDPDESEIVTWVNEAVGLLGMKIAAATRYSRALRSPA